MTRITCKCGKSGQEITLYIEDPNVAKKLLNTRHCLLCGETPECDGGCDFDVRIATETGVPRDL